MVVERVPISRMDNN